MNSALLVAFWLNVAATLLLTVFGVTYLLRKEFMPYHAVAVGKSWEYADPGVKGLVLGLMRAVGGLCLTIVLIQAVLLLGPYRHGASWAHWLVPTAGLGVTGASVLGMGLVAQLTPAKPPFALPAAGATLSLSALCIPFL